MSAYLCNPPHVAYLARAIAFFSAEATCPAAQVPQFLSNVAHFAHLTLTGSSAPNALSDLPGWKAAPWGAPAPTNEALIWEPFFLAEVSA